MDIKIDAGLARIQYERNGINYDKILTLDTFISLLASEYGFKSPLLTPGTRYYEKKDQRHILFVEIPPVCRHIKFINRDRAVIFEGVTPFPWTLLEIVVAENADGGFTLVANEVRIFALARPLLDLDDMLYKFPAANIFDDNRICWGSTFSNGNDRFKTLGELGRLIDLYFSSNFNTDISPRINKYTRYEDMLRAIKDTKTFDNSILHSTGIRLQTLIDHIG